MDLMIIQSSVTLFEILCVIIVFALLFMRSRYFSEVFEHHPTFTTQVLVIIFFGLMSIFGTLSGITIQGAVVNIRDLGPMAAGLLCGPVIGVGSGIIGGLFRFAQGGPYLWTGLSAPILSGLLGGILYLANRRRFVPIWMAVLFIGLSETLISCYTLILVTRPADFFSVVTSVAIPMVIYNVIGMFIFASVVYLILDERNRQQNLLALELELESRRNLSTVINTILLPVYVLGRDHRFTVVNNSMCRFLSRTREEILGKTPRDFLNEQDSQYLRERAEDVFLRHASREDEVTITKPDGQIEIIISTLTLYTDTGGKEFLVGILQEITERKKMQVALAENEAWYRILFEHTGAATIIINEDGTIDQANSEVSRLIGYSREEIAGRMSITQFVHPDDLEMVKKYHRERRDDSSSTPTAYPLRVYDRSGTIRTLHAVVALIPGTRKSIASYVDISDQKRSEEALSLLNRKLNLLSSITRHDIINQLMVLKGFLTMLEGKTADPVLRDYIARGSNAAANIERQINFTRDYQDMGVHSPSWQNLRLVIIGAKGSSALHNVTVTTDCPDIEIFADPLFEKVFFNLIDNSLKYGGVMLQVIRISSQETDAGLVITVQDDGVGISQNDKAHLFERGFGKHTGFGLFLSREILSITGITIRETSRPGEGARFEILVPKGMYRLAASSK